MVDAALPGDTVVLLLGLISGELGLIGIHLRHIEVDLGLVGVDGRLRRGNGVEIGHAFRGVVGVGLALAAVGVERRDGVLERGLCVVQVDQVGLVCGVEGQCLLVGCELVLVGGHLGGVLRVGQVHLGDGVVVGLLRVVH